MHKSKEMEKNILENKYLYPITSGNTKIWGLVQSPRLFSQKEIWKIFIKKTVYMHHGPQEHNIFSPTILNVLTKIYNHGLKRHKWLASMLSILAST